MGCNVFFYKDRLNLHLQDQPCYNMSELWPLPTEIDGSELPWQRVPNAGCHNHDEGAENGPHLVRVLPSRPDRPVWIHCLLPIQVCPAWLSWVSADGGEFLYAWTNTDLHRFPLYTKATCCNSKHLYNSSNNWLIIFSDHFAAELLVLMWDPIYQKGALVLNSIAFLCERLIVVVYHQCQMVRHIVQWVLLFFYSR